MTSDMLPRVAVFVDGSFLYNRLKERAGKACVKWAPFGNKICGKGKLVSFNYYNVPLDANKNPKIYDKQRKMFASIEKIPGGKVVLGTLVRRGNTYVEKGVDVKLCLDMVLLALVDEYDQAILVAGDGDFSTAVDIVTQVLHKKVAVAYFSNTLSPLLAKACDERIRLDIGFFDDLWCN